MMYRTVQLLPMQRSIEFVQSTKLYSYLTIFVRRSTKTIEK